MAVMLTASFYSCTPGFKTYCIGYQSVRTTFEQPEQVPANAQIAVFYTFTYDGKLVATVYNRTDEILTIDQTKSFFVDTDGTSTSYYDPTIRTTTTTDMQSSSTGASMNLGALAGAVGIGGTVGRLLGGINVGGSSGGATAISNTTYRADMQQISIGPRGNGNMTKQFNVTGLGSDYIDQHKTSAVINPYFNPDTSPKKFSVCITYSTDEGASYRKLVTNFYVSGEIIQPVENSKNLNATLRKIYESKPDALYQPWYILHCPNNSDRPSVTSWKNGINDGLIYDFN